MEKSHFDVIISGAGPTGLVLANLLKLDFLLIDKSEG
jgi:2-polyprenyl-6-methoxyphenol hydroxylase-like FAD-dependent oxidoreductase